MESVKKLKEMQQQNKVVQMPLDFSLTDKGNIKTNSIKNIGLILEHDPKLIHTFAFNEFTHEIEIIKNVKSLKINV